MFELKPRAALVHYHHHDDSASHIYEEIPDTNEAIYLDVLHEIDLSTKKIVRFNNALHKQPQPSKCETLSSFKCILKKSPSPSVSLHSPQSNHSMSSTSSSASSSSSNGQIYTNSSIASSSSSIHSVAFNALIDTVLNRFHTSPAKRTQPAAKSSPNSTSISSLAKNSPVSGASPCCRCGLSADESRLSFRVTNLTLEDLKIRQRMIKKTQERMNGCGSAVQV